MKSFDACFFLDLKETEDLLQKDFCHIVGWAKSSKTSARFCTGILDSFSENPKDLQGEFILLQWSSQNKVLTVHRDKMGIMPFYYHITDKEIKVANNLRAIGESLPDKKANFSYLEKLKKDNYQDNRSTAYQGIHRLPPAHCMKFKFDGQWALLLPPCPYWEPRLDGRGVTTMTSLKETLLQAIKNRVEIQHQSHLLYSGGFDSTLLFKIRSFLGQTHHTRSLHLAFNSVEANAQSEVHRNADLLGEEVECIDYCPSIHENPSRYIFYTPNLYFFEPLIKASTKIKSSFCWTGLGGDDLFSLDIRFYADLPLSVAFSDLTTKEFLKVLFYKLPSFLIPPLLGITGRKTPRLKAFFKREFKVKYHQKNLLERLFLSGGYTFGIEQEQELAIANNGLMSYPLLDEQFFEVVLRLPPEKFRWKNGMDKVAFRELDLLMPKRLSSYQYADTDYSKISEEVLEEALKKYLSNANPSPYEETHHQACCQVFKALVEMNGPSN